MFIRISRVKRAGKLYEYPQLVESYRKPNGRPAHRVLASLKGLSPQAVDNLRAALAAARDGSPVVLPGAGDGLQVRHEVVANLRFLDLAVLHRAWQEWRLDEIVARLAPEARTRVPVEKVIETLVLHRAVAPASKLAAARWFPKTALPELLDVKPRHFNNSRVHRTLELVHDLQDDLQDALAQRVAACADGFRVAYLDLTDTWFVGRGPELARRGKTKEGLRRRKVGIALLCDQRGLPLHWRTVEGNLYEPRVMLDLLRAAREAGTLDRQPVVMDRAVGRGAHLDALTRAEVAYVSALVRGEFDSFVSEPPWKGFEDIEVSGSERVRKREVARLSARAQAAGLTPSTGGRLLKDLGVVLVERAASDGDIEGAGSMAALLAEVEHIQWLLEQGHATLEGLAEWYGCDGSQLWRYRQLDKLVDAIKQRVRTGEAQVMGLSLLVNVARLPPEEQVAAFEASLVAATQNPPQPRRPKILDKASRTLALRLVISFQPERLIERRAAARRKLDQFRAFLRELNRKQAEASRPKSAVQLLATVRQYLEKKRWLSLFELSTRTRRRDGQFEEVVAEICEEAWRRRRRLDGFTVLLAHPHVRATSEELVELYFSKDVIEKDFKVIKSEIELRPVHHHTDPKVHAHVTICMLALLLCRTVEAKLRKQDDSRSATTVVEELANCHLNQVEPSDGHSYYTITSPTAHQQELLRALGMADLANNTASHRLHEVR